MAQSLLVLLMLMSLQKKVESPVVPIQADRVEPYRWKFDRSEGFKLIATIEKPEDSVFVRVFSGICGWEILRAEPWETAPKDAGASFSTRSGGLNEWWIDFYRESVVAKPDSMEISFWFHRMDSNRGGPDVKEFFDIQGPHYISDFIRIERKGFNRPLLQKMRMAFENEIDAIRGCVGTTPIYPFGCEVRFANAVEHGKVFTDLSRIEDKYGLFRVTRTSFLSEYDFVLEENP